MEILLKLFEDSEKATELLFSLLPVIFISYIWPTNFIVVFEIEDFISKLYSNI